MTKENTFQAWNSRFKKGQRVVHVYGTTPRAAAIALINRVAFERLELQYIEVQEGRLSLADGREVFDFVLVGGNDRHWKVLRDQIDQLPADYAALPDLVKIA